MPRAGARRSESGFRFDAYPGRYMLQSIVGGGPSLYLDSVLLGDRDITMQESEVTPAMPPFTVVLRSRGGTVTVTVNQHDVPGMVMLIPQEGRLRWEPFLRRSMQSAGGRWAFSNVPGDYYTLAIAGILRPEDAQDPALLEALLPRAATIRVERGSTVTLALLSVTPGAR